MTSPTPQPSPDSIRAARRRDEQAVVSRIRAMAGEDDWTPATSMTAFAASIGLSLDLAVGALARLLYRGEVGSARTPGGFAFQVVPTCRQAERD